MGIQSPGKSTFFSLQTKIQIYPWITELTSAHVTASVVLKHNPLVIHLYVG